MSKFSCSNNLRDYFKPLATTEEISRLKQYAIEQKHLAFRLIKYQRWFTSNYHRRVISAYESNQPSTRDSSPLIPPIEQRTIPMIKLDHCSTLIAAGRGIGHDRMSSSWINPRTDLSYSPMLNEDISLSKGYHLTNRHVQ